jgi:hypothetical protein
MNTNSFLFAIATAAATRLAAGAGAATDAAPYDACVQCHENLPGRLSAVVEEWRRSVHHEHQVTCAGCHGGDPTVRREQFTSEEEFTKRSHLRRAGRIFVIADTSGSFVPTVRGRAVSYFCGACHSTIKEKHLGSPHGNLGEPSCLYCHGRGSHAIDPPRLAIVDTRGSAEGGRCALCHRAATMETVKRIKNMLSDAETRLSTAVDQYAWLQHKGYKNLALDRMYEHSQDTRSKLRRTFHSFNMREITNFVSALNSNADRTQQIYDMIADLVQVKRRQAVTAGLVILLLLAFAALLLYYRHTVLNHQ